MRQGEAPGRADEHRRERRAATEAAQRQHVGDALADAPAGPGPRRSRCSASWISGARALSPEKSTWSAPRSVDWANTIGGQRDGGAGERGHQDRVGAPRRAADAGRHGGSRSRGPRRAGRSRWPRGTGTRRCRRRRGGRARRGRRCPSPSGRRGPRNTSDPMPAASRPGRSTTPIIGPASPATSMRRKAPRSGEPSSVLMAAKLPAAPMTTVACCRGVLLHQVHHQRRQTAADGDERGLRDRPRRRRRG